MSMGTVARIPLMTRAATTLLLALALVATSAAGIASASDNIRVDLKVLVMSGTDTDDGLEAWESILDRSGVPYDVFIAVDEPPLTDDVLSSGVDHAKYQAVLLASSTLDDCSSDPCVNVFTPEEWAVLDAYQARFAIRRVSGNTYPNPSHGYSSSGLVGRDISGERANLTAAGLARFPSLAGPVDFGVGTYGYLATPEPLADFTTLLSGPDGGSTMGIYVRPDGIEELVLTFAMGPSSLHAYLLGHGIVSWATRGVYLGFERSYFTFDIDDVLLPDDRWDMVNNTTHEDNCATLTCIRMDAGDVARASAWSATTGLDLTMVYNAVGSQDAIETSGSDPLTDAIVADRYDFRWINHQWSHEEFDFLTQKEMIREIELNLNWAADHDIPINPKELVTGSHSGLHKAETAGALDATGVEWLASDNSREPDPYAIGGATTLPRHPANVYYNVGSFAEQLDEYNYIFWENCVNTPTTTCFTQAQTWPEYVNNEATIMLPHVLGNDPRPHYFHQANLAEDGTFYPVVDEVLQRYNLYMSTPIVQPNYRAASDAIRRGSDWDGAKGATEAYYQLGHVYLTSPGTAQAPITGTADGELYGGERSGWVTLRPSETRIVDLSGFSWPVPSPGTPIVAD